MKDKMIRDLAEKYLAPPLRDALLGSHATDEDRMREIIPMLHLDPQRGPAGSQRLVVSIHDNYLAVSGYTLPPPPTAGGVSVHHAIPVPDIDDGVRVTGSGGGGGGRDAGTQADEADDFMSSDLSNLVEMGFEESLVSHTHTQHTLEHTHLSPQRPQKQAVTVLDGPDGVLSDVMLIGQARDALRKNRFDVERAVNMLMGLDPVEEASAFPTEQVQRISSQLTLRSQCYDMIPSACVSHSLSPWHASTELRYGPLPIVDLDHSHRCGSTSSQAKVGLQGVRHAQPNGCGRLRQL